MFMTQCQRDYIHVFLQGTGNRGQILWETLPDPHILRDESFHKLNHVDTTNCVHGQPVTTIQVTIKQHKSWTLKYLLYIIQRFGVHQINEVQ